MVFLFHTRFSLLVIIFVIKYARNNTFKLSENISKEEKSIFLLGDSHVNLLNYNEHNQTNEFLESLASNTFLPLISQPTRKTSHATTLIDNVFSNVTDRDIISVNLTANIFNHLPQFAIIPKLFGNISSNMCNIYEKDWLRFFCLFFC